MKGYVTKSLQFLACLFFLTMNALAANPSSLADGAQLLKGSERIAVLNEIGSIEKEYGVRLAVVTVKTTNNVKIGDYANQLLDSTYKDGKNGSMVLAMDTRDYYLATDTAMRQRISDKGGIPALEEKCLPLLKEKKYADAFKAYALETGELLAYYEANGKAYDPHDAFSWTALLIALILGIGGGFLIRRYLINTMSNVVPALAASAYLDENSFDLTEKEDTFLFMNVSRTAKAKKSERHDSTDEKHGGGGGKF
ncbi:YgcG family protein [Megasphaera sp.]|uniref:TPM domain-containing protein n=1 Tax=Megasphaera sp. TaxID=2023260 RepID=UPI002610B10C|nr:TPM domain-containing protein [uncultured Megasphaera sp.]